MAMAKQFYHVGEKKLFLRYNLRCTGSLSTTTWKLTRGCNKVTLRDHTHKHNLKPACHINYNHCSL